MLTSQVPLTVGFKTYKCIFGNQITDATLQSDLKSFKCITPADNAPVPRNVDITINQGESCSSNGKDGCCSILSSCFIGSLSFLPIPYFYYDDVPIKSLGAILFSDSLTHAHVFFHQQHHLSNFQHAHIVLVGKEYLLARSVTVSRSCKCYRGNFDCFCADNTNRHSHVLVHSHPYETVTHTHQIYVRSPAIGTVSTPSNSAGDYLQNPMIPLYGLGAYDAIPSAAVSSIQDSTILEDSIIIPDGTSISVSPGVDLSVGKNLSIFFDGAASIQNQLTPGVTDNYEVDIVKTKTNSTFLCFTRPGYCRLTLQRLQTSPDLILNTQYRFIRLVPSTTFTGASVTVGIELVNGVQYYAGSSLIILFPPPLMFSSNPALLICHQSSDCVDLTDLSGASASVQMIPNDHNLGCYGSFSCIQIKFRYGISVFSNINFNLTGLQLPVEAVADPLTVAIYTLDPSNVTIDAPKSPVLFPSILAAPLLQVFLNFSSSLAGENVLVYISFNLSNPWDKGDMIRINFPAAYILNNSTILHLSIYVNDSAISYPHTALISTNSLLDMHFLGDLKLPRGSCFRIQISGIQLPQIPGAGGGLSIQILSINMKAKALASYQLPPISPARMIAASASFSSMSTGAQSKLNFSFVNAANFLPGSDIIITLPSGFALCSDASSGWKLKVWMEGVQPSGYCSLTACPNDASNCTLTTCNPALSTVDNSRIRISWGINCSELISGTKLSFQVTYIRNSLIEGPSGKISAYIRTAGKCNPCAQEENVQWSQGLSDFYLRTSKLIAASLNLTSQRTGDLSNVTLKFATFNFLAAKSWVVIDVAQYFLIDPKGWYVNYSISLNNVILEKKNISSGSCCQKGTSLSYPTICCSAGQLIFFQINTAAPQGTLFNLQLFGVTNKITAGTSTFQIRTALSLWNFVDRALVSVVIYPTTMQGSVVPYSYTRADADSSVPATPSDKLVIGAVGSFSVGFRTVHMLPEDGAVQLEFSRGFSFLQARLIGSVMGMDGKVNISTDQGKLTLIRSNGTVLPSNTEIKFNVTGIRHPTTFEEPYIILRSLLQVGSPACDVCQKWQILDCQTCSSFGPVDETSPINLGSMNPGNISVLQVYVRPLSNKFTFFNVILSATCKFRTAGNFIAGSYVSIQLPNGYLLSNSNLIVNSSVDIDVNETISSQSELRVRIERTVLEGTDISISFDSIRAPLWPVNASIFSIQTIGGCSSANCILEQGTAVAMVLFPDLSGLTPFLTASQASIGALAAGPTKGVAFGATLVWDFTTFDYQGVNETSNHVAYVQSNCTTFNTYSISTRQGTYGVQFPSSYKGAICGFELYASIQQIPTFFGVSYVMLMNTSEAPRNLSAVISGPLQAALSWISPKDQGIGADAKNFIISYIIDIWKTDAPESSLRSKEVFCCNDGPSCCDVAKMAIDDNMICLQSGSYIPCISSDFAGNSISFQMKTINAAGVGSSSSAVNIPLIGRAGQLNLSARSLSFPNSSVAGIYVNWTYPGQNFNFGFGRSNTQAFDFELDIYQPDQSTEIPTSVTFPSNITEYWIKSGLVIGQEYYFRVRITTGQFPGQWSIPQIVRAIKRPESAQIQAISSGPNRTLTVLFYLMAESDPSIYSRNFGASVLQMKTLRFLPCCSSSTPWVGCDSSQAITSIDKEFSVSLDAMTLEMINYGLRSESMFLFNATNLEPGIGYSFKIRPYNEAGPSLEWSYPSDVVQCQDKPIPSLYFSEPIFGDETVQLRWNTTSPFQIPDFTYRLSRATNPQYPFQSNQDFNPTNDMGMNAPLDQHSLVNTPNVQNVRSYGSTDIDSIEVDGNLLVVIANSRAYSPFNSGSLEETFEASMIFQWNSSSQSFGGDCVWGEPVDCSKIGPACAAFAQNPICSKNQTISNEPTLMDGFGVKQMIQSFGAIKSKFMKVDGQAFLMILNTKVPVAFSCFYNFGGLLRPAKVSSGQITEQLSIFEKKTIEFITPCRGIADNTTCGAAICRPSAFVYDQAFHSEYSDDNSTYSFVYRWDNRSNLFVEHSVFTFQRPRHIESFTSISCVPSSTCDSCRPCLFPVSGCICRNSSYFVVSDEAGQSEIYEWNSSTMTFNLLQTLASRGAKASKYFSAFNFSLLFVAYSGEMATSVTQNSSYYFDGSKSFLYRLENGVFKSLLSVPTFGANHVESFERNGRQYLVICNGIQGASDGDENEQSPCIPNISCPVLYEFTQDMTLKLVQSFDGLGLNQAVSSMAFTRQIGNISENFLLFAMYRSFQNNRSDPAAYSRLYKWTTTVNSWGEGENIFDSFVLVRMIYTRGARAWSLISNADTFMLAVANEADFRVNITSSSCSVAQPPCPYPNAGNHSCYSPVCIGSCNYRSSSSCCGMAGEPCFFSNSSGSNQFSPYYDAQSQPEIRNVGISTFFILPHWPELTVDLLYNCSNNSVTVDLLQTKMGQDDWEYYGNPTVFTVSSLNSLTSSQPISITVRPLKLPGPPILSSVDPRGNRSILVKLQPPLDDGEIPVPGRSSVRMKYKVLVLFGRVNTFSNSSVADCRKSLTTDVTNILISGLGSGEVYSIVTFAINPAGQGPASGIISVLTFGPPGKVENLNVTQGLGPKKFILNWDQPLNLGAGPNVTAALEVSLVYKISIYTEKSPGLRALDPFVQVNVGNVNQISIPDDLDYEIDFIKGRVYFFSVSASTFGGNGVEQWVSACALSIASRPVLNSVAVAGPGRVVLQWTAPVDTGAGAGQNCFNPLISHDTGDKVAGIEQQNGLVLYVLEVAENLDFIPLVKINGSTLLRKAPSLSSAFLDGLTVGKVYYFRLFAETRSGTSLPSQARASIVGNIPSSPRSLSVYNSAPLALTISFALPADTGLGIDGGDFQLSGFDLDESKDLLFNSISRRLTLPNNETRIILTGMSEGVKFYFRVRATNIVGIGEYSETVSGTSLNIPSAPEDLFARAGQGLSIILNWKVIS